MNPSRVDPAPADARSWYEGCRAVLATRHGKEAVVGPALESSTGMRVEVPSDLDTDALGTFSGETERRGAMRDAAVAKARLGMQASGLAVGLASEGSYGPHPVIPFLRGGVELLVLVDEEWDMVVEERLVVERPRFGHLVLAGPGWTPELDAFLGRMDFPAHGMVVLPVTQGGAPEPVAKGIHDRSDLELAIAEAARRAPGGRVRVETDMRANHNPTRMESIRGLARIMGERLLTLCRLCGCPGYGLTRRPRGLPCAVCSTPTTMLSGEVHGCPVCGYEEHLPRWDGLTRAEPAHCPECNP